MTDLILCALRYVVADLYFWPSMTYTVVAGLFVGAVIHDGDLRGVGKTLFSLASYATLILMVNLTRIIPQVHDTSSAVSNQPLASTVTVFLVTFFYLLGMLLGVGIVRYAHRLKRYKV